MAGLATALRLSMFGKSVLLVEKHTTPGGLNSFYRLGDRKFDVGLHALTNYSEKSFKNTPLGILFRQLRLSRREIVLHPQKRSKVQMPGFSLEFTNDPDHFRAQVRDVFPSEIDAYDRFSRDLPAFDDVDFSQTPCSARERLSEYFQNRELIDALCLPAMYYGNPKRGEMDFNSFAIIFRSIILEGIARPEGGIRPLIKNLLAKIKKSGGEIHLNCGVQRMEHDGHKVKTIHFENGNSVQADCIFSSVGQVETAKLCAQSEPEHGKAGEISFVEILSVFKKPLADLGFENTLVFFNRQNPFCYDVPGDPVDYNSGVICCPDNYTQGPSETGEGLLRVTFLANPSRWMSYDESNYLKQKHLSIKESDKILPDLLKWSSGARFSDVVFRDMFTPKTIHKFTNKINGAVYGSEKKVHSGKTPLENLYLMGTDQGYLGVVGSMLSGIIMANDVVLRRELKGQAPS